MLFTKFNAPQAFEKVAEEMKCKDGVEKIITGLSDKLDMRRNRELS